MLTRREFIEVTSACAAGALLPPLISCGPDHRTENRFPQGIASGDPGPSSVILWTRVAPDNPEKVEKVAYEVALDRQFAQIVARGEVNAFPEYDHTVRVKIEGLRPFTYYFYRFHCQGVSSRTGRTLTAPNPDEDVPVRFAVASCQDYVGRYYYSWGDLVEAEERFGPIHFVLFLGDYIYEYETGSDVILAGSQERRVQLPQGLRVEKSLA